MNQMGSRDDMGLIGNEFNPFDRQNTKQLLHQEDEVKRGFKPMPPRARAGTEAIKQIQIKQTLNKEKRQDQMGQKQNQFNIPKNI